MTLTVAGRSLKVRPGVVGVGVMSSGVVEGEGDGNVWTCSGAIVNG